MTTIALEDVQARLAQWIEGLAPGDEVVLTRDARPIARIVGLDPDPPRPILGRGRGKLFILVEDDEHLQGFEDVCS